MLILTSKTITELSILENFPSELFYCLGTVQTAYDRKFKDKTPEEIGKEAMEDFIDQYFEQTYYLYFYKNVLLSDIGEEILNCIPSDWEEAPSKLASIKDNTLRQWAYKLNNIWKQLCRKVLHFSCPYFILELNIR